MILRIIKSVFAVRRWFNRPERFWEVYARQSDGPKSRSKKEQWREDDSYPLWIDITAVEAIWLYNGRPIIETNNEAYECHLGLHTFDELIRDWKRLR